MGRFDWLLRASGGIDLSGLEAAIDAVHNQGRPTSGPASPEVALAEAYRRGRAAAPVGLAPLGGAPAPAAPPGAAPAQGAPSNPYHNEFVRATAAAGVPASWATSPALLNLVKHESSFNPNLKNPKSTAYGLFQFIDSTWRSTGVARTSDPYQQAVAGFRYIRNTYGTPERAWAFWQATKSRNPSLAPADLQAKARHWISHDYIGY